MPSLQAGADGPAPAGMEPGQPPQLPTRVPGCYTRFPAGGGCQRPALPATTAGRIRAAAIAAAGTRWDSGGGGLCGCAWPGWLARAPAGEGAGPGSLPVDHLAVMLMLLLILKATHWLLPGWVPCRGQLSPRTATELSAAAASAEGVTCTGRHESELAGGDRVAACYVPKVCQA